jgi:hypothetical protein
MTSAIDKSRLMSSTWDARLPDRFWAKTRIEDTGYSTPCITWTASKLPTGYGRFNWQRKSCYAHRVAYEVLVDRIPEGMVIDHLCRNRACVNVEHLEPVTSEVNILRGTGAGAVNAAKTHCDRGHEFTEANTRPTGRGGRECIACEPYWREAWNAQRRAARAARTAVAGTPKPPRTRCYNGHLLDEANIYVDKRGRRYCRKCLRARAKRSYDRRKVRSSAAG